MEYAGPSEFFKQMPTAIDRQCLISDYVNLCRWLGRGGFEVGVLGINENGHQGKHRVEETKRVGDQRTHIVQLQSSDEESRSTERAPEHGKGAQQVAPGRVQGHDKPKGTYKHQWQQAVANDGRRTGQIDLDLVTHKFEKIMQADNAENTHTVDVSKLDFSR